MDDLKAEANKAFAASRYTEADALYTKALAQLEYVAVPAPQPVRERHERAAGNGAQAEAKPMMSAKTDSPEMNGHAKEKFIGEGKTPNGNGVASEDGDETMATADEPSAGSETAAVIPRLATNDALGKQPQLIAKPDATAIEPAEISPEAQKKAVLLSNRALTRIRLEQYGFAINDANDALALDPTYVKPLYRRGTAHLALGNVRLAQKDFREILARHPKDFDSRMKLEQCTRVIREERFARALQVDGYDSDGSVSSTGSNHSACDSVDLDSIPVEDAYTGPALPEGATVDADFVSSLIDLFRKQGKLHYKYAVSIVLQAKELFDALPNIVEVPVPTGSKITVCGDVHGQFYDLADSIFAKNGMPSPENPYVFNGDFVDRGSFSVEVILTLLAIKVACPEAIHLTRGNHESVNMNKIYGFEGEVKAKYSRDIFFRVFTELFQSLPLAYILDGTADGSPEGRKAFIVHGGLFSRNGVTIAELQELNRRREPDDGLMAEMLWSDPQPTPGWGPSKRGIGVSFGPDVTHRFLDTNGLDIVVRSHEMKDEGYEVAADGRLVTIFSAPNYCDQMGNKGAYIGFDHRMQPKFTQFSAVPHPNVKAMAYASGWMGLM